jgi:hypothetical protein
MFASTRGIKLAVLGLVQLLTPKKNSRGGNGSLLGGASATKMMKVS